MSVILVLIALVAGVFLWQKLMESSSKALNQRVLRRGTHQRGQDAVHTGITFVCPNRSATEVTRAVRDALALPSSGTGITHKPYLASEGSTWLKIEIGNLLSTRAEMLFSTADQAAGCDGILVVKSWSESEGIVTTISEIEAVQTRVQEALRAADSAVRIDQEVVE